MSKVEPKVGIDALTLSGRSEVIGRLWSRLDELVLMYHNDGEKVKKLKEFDYGGMRIGHIAYFDNGTHGYIRSEAEAAPTLMAYEEGYDVRCTRIDLCATMETPPYAVPASDGRLHVDAGQIVFASGEASERVGPPSMIRRGGCTVYVGSRANDTYLRVYDKTSEDPLGGWNPHSWRWEVEIKTPRSQKIYGGLKTLSVIERKKAILNYIAGWCDRRGIYHPFEGTEPSSLDDTRERRTTPLDRKLVWLENAVRPSVLTLIDHDLVVPLLKALGIAGSPIVAQHIIRALKMLGHGK